MTFVDLPEGNKGGSLSDCFHFIPILQACSVVNAEQQGNQTTSNNLKLFSSEATMLFLVSVELPLLAMRAACLDWRQHMSQGILK